MNGETVAGCTPCMGLFNGSSPTLDEATPISDGFRGK